MSDLFAEIEESVLFNEGMAVVACPILGCEADMDMPLRIHTTYTPNDQGGNTFGLSMDPDLTAIGEHLATHAVKEE